MGMVPTRLQEEAQLASEWAIELASRRTREKDQNGKCEARLLMSSIKGEINQRGRWVEL